MNDVELPSWSVAMDSSINIPNVSLPSVSMPQPDISLDADNGSDLLGGFDLKGVASLAGVLGSLWGANEERKYKKELLKREDERIARDRARQDKFESSMNKAYA